jgi:mannose-1-phosphate guanylyltransferase
MNSDIICKFPLRELLEFHKSHSGMVSMLSTKVDEPSKYGVLVSQRGKVEKFVEKP